ncbi:MAG TPA: YidC/Oxa1 family membrane protein insertase [Candidatus Saccharimonadia bacterium]|nr:YidC/Oxa1 family membrane protein insertase [Candidatus Saccharimonadia bacterium]
MFNTILVQPLFNLLAFIYAVIPFHDFGVAIILLTIVVRLLLWPLVNKQLHSQRALQELQPELQRIKSQVKGDKQLEGKLVMELYKEKEINPFASFLPLLIQLPIFFALFVVLRDVVKPGEIAQLAYEPVKHLGPIADIIHGTHTFDPKFLGVVVLAKASPILAVLAAIAQFVQTKQLQPKQKAKDAQAQMMAGMIYLFPVLTFIVGLSLPSALALYWTTTSLVAILQQYLVLQRDVVELEASIDTPAPAKLSGGKAKAKGGKA